MSTIFPGSASVGQVYNGYSFNGTAWDIIGNEFNPTSFSPTAPENPKAGDLWVDSDSNVPSISPETILTITSASSTYQPLVAGVSSTEIGYLDGVTSAIQTQIDARLTLASASTTYLPLSAATANQVVYKNSSNVAAGSSGLTYDGTHLKVNGNLESRYSSGDEGGEFILNKATTNTTLTTGVVIDVNRDRLRIFEQGGNNRGVYIDLANSSNSVGTSITPGIGGVPYRMAAGSVSVGSNSPVSVTFPSSRFSVSPIVQVTGTNGWGWFSNLSSTGVVIYQTTSWGGASQSGTMHWTAVQMTSGAADG
jgi:hypothetical protein